MENKKISNPKIDFREEDTNSIFFEETKNQDIIKLRKKVNYLTFFVLILVCGLGTALYFNFKKIMLEVKDTGTESIESFSKEIESQIAILTAVNSDFKKNIEKKTEDLEKSNKIIIKDFEKISKNKIDRKEFEKISNEIDLLSKNRTASDELTKKISDDLKKILKDSLEGKITKSELDERIAVFEKDIRIKLLQLAGDTENMISNAKKEIEKDVDKKISVLIKDFEVSMQKYLQENIR